MALGWTFDRKFKLINGLLMPAIGLGTFKIKSTDIETAIRAAVKANNCGLIDTAAVYRNEALIASTLKKLDIKREDIFITSKLAPKDHGLEKAKAAFETTLKALNTSYLDLYLIHWPGVQSLKVDDPENQRLRAESWSVLEGLYEKGLVKAIGVSNYSIQHLAELLQNCKVQPHVNQIEIHPHYQQRQLVAFCKDHDIHVTAYSSLGTSDPASSSQLLTDPVVIRISEELDKRPAQVLLVWALQKGHSVVPKSTNPKHIEQNIDLDFKLNKDQIEALDSIEINKKYAWNPELVV
jgi:diketogulonate reductase-like aldo/keto reductase